MGVSIVDKTEEKLLGHSEGTEKVEAAALSSGPRFFDLAFLQESKTGIVP